VLDTYRRSAREVAEFLRPGEPELAGHVEGLAAEVQAAIEAALTAEPED
jgi:hypothetical protein